MSKTRLLASSSSRAVAAAALVTASVFGEGALAAEDAEIAVTAVQAAGAQTPDTVSNTSDDDDGADTDDRIVVTGSRIQRTGFDTATPTVVIGQQEIAQRGAVNILDLLNELPSVQESFGLEFIGGQADIGVQRANLRGLSTHRSLVVVNNKRRVTTNTETDARGFQANSFDLSVIPNALIERVDVVTGGASSIYGSDAVSGAINVILKDDFDGLQVGGNYGRREGGDQSNWQAYVTAGKNFDRGNVVFHVEATQSTRLSRSELGVGGFSGRIGNDWAASVPLLDPSLGPDERVNFFNDLVDYSLPGNTDRTMFVPQLRTGADWTGFWLPVDGAGDVIIDPITGLPLTTDGFTSNEQMRDTYGFAIYDHDLGKLRAADMGTTGALGSWRCSASAGCEIEAYDFDIVIPQERINAYNSIRYDVTDNISFIGEGIYSRSRSVRNQNPSDPGVWFPAGFEPAVEIWVDVIDDNGVVQPGQTRQSPFFTDAFVDQLTTLDPLLDTQASGDKDDQFFVGVRQLNEHGPRYNSYEREYISLSGGFEGELSNGWNWTVTYDWGRSELIWTRFNDHQDPALVAATDIVYNQDSGQFVCADATWRALGCAPADLIQGMNAAAVDFLTFDDTNVHYNEQQMVQAFITGDTSDFLVLPAGPVQFAAGIEWRETQSVQDPGNGFAKGLTYGGESRAQFDITTAVKEAYSEFVIPVIKDAPFADSIEIEGAIRVTDHNTGGTDVTWKAGGSWVVNDDIRIRGMRARAVRTPTGPELFLPITRTFTSMTDPCDTAQYDPSADNHAIRLSNCMAILGLDEASTLAFTAAPSNIAEQGGNPNLRSEVADTVTGGIVLTPSWAPGLQLLADYYKIRISDLVSTFSVGSILTGCALNETGPDNPLCDLVTRDPTSGQIRLVSNTGTNIDEQVVEGVDFEARYNFDVADLVGLVGGSSNQDLGNMNLRAVGGWQATNRITETDAFSGTVSVLDDSDRVQSPKFTTRFQANYNRGPFSAYWGAVWTEDVNDPRLGRAVEGIWFHDASVSYALPWNSARLTAGVNNVFNTSGRRDAATCCSPNSIDRGLNSRRLFISGSVHFGGQ